MEITQSFLKGINRSISRKEFFDPEFFWSTQNARILQTGNVGEVVRIKGFQKISSELDDLDTLHDMILVNNSAVGTVNNYVVFYQDLSDTFRLKIFNEEGTLQDSFSYTDNSPFENAQLKQHSNSIFIAPHNKILYGVNGNYFLREFISEIPKIVSANPNPEQALKARYNLTVNETVQGIGGRKAKGKFRYGINSVPPNMEESFFITIDGVKSQLVGPFKNIEYTELLPLMANAINQTPELSSDWTAFVQGREVIVESNSIGTQNNNVRLNIVEESLVTKTRTPIGPGRIGEDGFLQPFMFYIENTKGGLEEGTVFGSARITIKDAIVTDSIEIVSTDSRADIASKFQQILSTDNNVTDQYTINRSGDTLDIEAKEIGKEYNTNVTIVINDEAGEIFDLTENFTTLTQTREGRDSTTTGTIEPFKNYWYAGRLRFLDGHLTRTCPAVKVNSGPVSPIQINFEIPQEDLDGTEAKLQIFRKRENGEFFLIEEVNLDEVNISGNNFVYIDDGLSRIEPLEENDIIWTKSHQVQEVVDNRFVKANVDFFDEEYNISQSDFELSTSSVSDGIKDVAPYNSKGTIYVRPQYTDGSLGYFKSIGNVNIQDEDHEIRVRQTGLASNNEKDISELKFYGRYIPFGEKQNLRFNAPEINTQFLGSIEDPLLFSDVTKVFFGYKHVMVYEDYVFTRIKGWNSSRDSTFGVKIAKVGTNQATIDSNNRLTINIHGEEFTYVPVAKHTSETGLEQTVYRLELFEALQQGVSTGSLNIVLKNSVEDGMSSKVSDDDLLNLEVNVTGIDDKTSGDDGFVVKTFTEISERLSDISYLNPKAEDQRLYLVLEESKFDEIDSNKINRFGFIDDTQNTDSFSDPDGNTTIDYATLDAIKPARVGFEILNFQEKEKADFDINDTNTHFSNDKEFQIVTLPNSKRAVYYLINRTLTFEDNAIYLGAKENQLDSSSVTLDTTGFVHKTKANLFYSVLAPHNIYETLIKQSDFNFDRTKFANQIMWSSPLLEGNYYSGGRNFIVTSFYNIPTENGDIIDVVSLNGNMFVFCEKGVAQVLIGETLTQQKSGNVFVDSSDFITKHMWMLENLPEVKRDSIVKVDGAIYFTDGIDVYRITGEGLNNISLGLLDVQSNVNYIGTKVKEYNEYRLSNPDTGETFVYNTKYEQWYGPYTYIPEKTIELDDHKIISYIDGLCQEDVGNTFNGQSYDTVIQSVGNDTEIGHFMKTYRKFYLTADNLQGSEFRYGKDYEDMEVKPLDNVIVKNGQHNIGIRNSEGNTQKIFWDLESNNEGFSLKGFKTLYHVRRRR